MTSEMRVEAGQVYATPDEESGRYSVCKVLYADESVVLLRQYVNLFDESPTEVPDGLRLDITLEELNSGAIGIGYGAVPIDATGFADDVRNFVLIGNEPITEEERENIEEAFNPPEDEGFMSRLKGLFGRRQ